MYGLSKKEAEKRAKDVLEIVGLEDKAEESAGVLSSGMRQKLALAKGLLIHAPVLLLDEPTVGLDPNAAYAARNFIKRELNQKLGQTVLLTTHYMFEAEQLCDRVAIMDKGKIIACGTPSELKKQMGGNVLLLESLNIGPPVLERLRASKLANRIFSSFSRDGTGVLRIHTHRDQTVKRENIERFLKSEGCQIVSSKIVEPTLEDVFMQLTGKEL
jgi:ABC-2 type transport system ATP-binding protein